MKESPEVAERISRLFHAWQLDTEAGRQFRRDYDRKTTPFRLRARWVVQGRHRTSRRWWRFFFSDRSTRLIYNGMERLT